MSSVARDIRRETSARSRSPRRRPCGGRAQPATTASGSPTLATAVEAGALDDDAGRGRSSAILELGLQTGRIRALYGPGGEQAALRLYRRLPGGSRAAPRARSEVTEALASLAGPRARARSRSTRSGPAASRSRSSPGRELSVRLDRQGARLASVERLTVARASATTWPAST